jgi:hypothetical protein
MAGGVWGGTQCVVRLQCRECKARVLRIGPSGVAVLAAESTCSIRLEVSESLHRPSHNPFEQAVLTCMAPQLELQILRPKLHPTATASLSARSPGVSASSPAAMSSFTALDSGSCSMAGAKTAPGTTAIARKVW